MNRINGIEAYPTVEVSSSTEPKASKIKSSLGRRSPVKRADVPTGARGVLGEREGTKVRHTYTTHSRHITMTDRRSRRIVIPLSPVRVYTLSRLLGSSESLHGGSANSGGDGGRRVSRHEMIRRYASHPEAYDVDMAASCNGRDRSGQLVVVVVVVVVVRQRRTRCFAVLQSMRGVRVSVAWMSG